MKRTICFRTLQGARRAALDHLKKGSSYTADIQLRKELSDLEALTLLVTAAQKKEAPSK